MTEIGIDNQEQYLFNKVFQAFHVTFGSSPGRKQTVGFPSCKTGQDIVIGKK